MFKRLLFFVCLILLSINIAFAQDSGEGWPIVERCVPEPTAPPADWTYPGVILATGWAGLHGIRSDLNKPYVIVFTKFFNGFEWQWDFDGFLSPDNRWLVTTDETGIVSHREPAPVPVVVNAFNVYSTLEDKQEYHITWEANYTIEAITGNGQYDYFQRIRWWDSEHLVYVNEGSQGMWKDESKLVLINPFTGKITDLPTNFQGIMPVLLPHFLAVLSPDKTRLLYEPSISPFFYLYDTATQTPFSVSLEENARWEGVPSWKPDSSQFLIRHEETDGQYSLYIHDKDGNPIELFYRFNGSTDSMHYPIENTWSKDGRYFEMYSKGEEGILYIADSLERIIINTCLNGGQEYIAWSPDETMLAYSAYRPSDNDPVRILDLKRWQSYTVAYHDGSIVGWRDGN